jgi:hypothetical protein
MTDNSSTNTSNISTKEGNAGLLKGCIFVLWLAQLAIDGLNGFLERGELNHSVGYLSAPKRVETFVETRFPTVREAIAVKTEL